MAAGWNPMRAEATLWLTRSIAAHASCTPVRGPAPAAGDDTGGPWTEDLVMKSRKALVAAVLLAVATSACGPRTVDVRTAPARAETNVRVTNSLGQAVNVYVLSRSEEHTSELQSRQYLVCRLLLEKKNI